MSCRSYSAHCFSISTRGGVVSTSATSKGKKNVQTKEGVRRTDAEKPNKLLTKWEFKERFCVLYGIAIRLIDDGPVSTENESFNATIFNKEQFNVELHFPLPSLFKQFLHFTKIPPTFLHPNAIKVLMRCNILNMFFHLDLSLLEILFIYTVKMSEKEIFSLSAHIPSLQLVIELPDSTKGAAKGHVVVLSPWAAHMSI